MSTNEVVSNTGNFAIVNTDTSKIFIWKNRYDGGTYTNEGYDDETLLAGTLMGRISATQKLAKHNSSNADGSQYPVGVLASDYTVEAGQNKEIQICVSGDVAEEMVLLHTGDTMDTVISGRSIRDRIGADTVGVNLVSSTEMTAYDNQ